MSETQSAVWLSGRPVTNLAKYGKGSDEGCRGESASVSDELFDEAAAGRASSLDGSPGLSDTALRLVERGNGECVTCGVDTDELMGEWPETRLHSTPWRTHALQGFCSSHWVKGIILVSGRGILQLQTNSMTNHHTLTLLCLHLRHPVLDFVYPNLNRAIVLGLCRRGANDHSGWIRAGAAIDEERETEMRTRSDSATRSRSVNQDQLAQDGYTTARLPRGGGGGWVGVGDGLGRRVAVAKLGRFSSWVLPLPGVPQ